MTYDANGNLLQRTDGTDTTTYDYDPLGRLTEVQTPSATRVYGYDAQGRRVSEQRGSTQLRHLFDGSQIAQTEMIGASTDPLTYLRGPEGRLISRHEGSSDPEYYHLDGMGSVSALTDDTGAVLNTYAYSAFGEVAHQTGSAPNKLAYLAQPYDAGTNLHDFQARSYAASDGRFLGRDPVAGSPGNPLSFNPYQYGYDNPFRWQDPQGTWGFDSALLKVMDAGHWLGGEYLEYQGFTPEAADLLQEGSSFSYEYMQKHVAKGDVNYLELAGLGIFDAATFGRGGAIKKGISAAKSLGKRGSGVTGLAPPSSPVGRKGQVLQRPEILPSANKPTTIRGREYSGHALDRMQDRGYVPSVIEDIITHGRMETGRRPGTIDYYKDRSKVVVDEKKDWARGDGMVANAAKIKNLLREASHDEYHLAHAASALEQVLEVMPAIFSDAHQARYAYELLEITLGMAFGENRTLTSEDRLAIEQASAKLASLLDSRWLLIDTWRSPVEREMLSVVTKSHAIILPPTYASFLANVSDGADMAPNCWHGQMELERLYGISTYHSEGLIDVHSLLDPPSPWVAFGHDSEYNHLLFDMEKGTDEVFLSRSDQYKVTRVEPLQVTFEQLLLELR